MVCSGRWRGGVEGCREGVVTIVDGRCCPPRVRKASSIFNDLSDNVLIEPRDSPFESSAK